MVSQSSFIKYKLEITSSQTCRTAQLYFHLFTTLAALNYIAEKNFICFKNSKKCREHLQ